MEYRDAVGSFARRAHVAGGVVHRVLDVAVFQVVHHLAHGHHGAVVLGFGSGGAQVRQHHGVRHAHDLGRGEVGDVGMHLARFQRRRHGRAVHQCVAREVQEHRAVLHDLAGVGVYHADGSLHGRHVDGQVVADAQQVVQFLHVMHGACDVPCCVHRHVGVVAVHVHAQVDGRVGHLRADGPQADDAQLLAHDLAPGEGLLGLFNRLGNVLVARVLAAPRNAARDVAAA